MKDTKRALYRLRPRRFLSLAREVRTLPPVRNSSADPKVMAVYLDLATHDCPLEAGWYVAFWREFIKGSEVSIDSYRYESYDALWQALLHGMRDRHASDVCGFPRNELLPPYCPPCRPE